MAGVLIGREAEEAQLHALVRDVAAGRGRSVLIEGEPGIGKSSLISAGIAEAASLGCRVLRGAADEFGGRFPLRVLLDCLANNGVGDVASMTGGDWGNVVSGSYDPVLAAMEGLLATVDRLCAKSPVVLAVDDLQWADEPSLAVWSQLSRSVTQVPLLLVAACRPEPPRAEVAGLRRLLAQQGVVIGLGPLDRQQVAGLVGELVGAPAGPALMRLAVRAGGNPLYVRELVDVLAREGRLRVEPGVATEVERGGEIAVPTSLRAAIVDRIESMTEGTQRVVRLAALLGHEFSVTDLAALLAEPAVKLTDALLEAYRVNVLVDSGPRSMFRHPLIRQALYEGIPEGLRAALHRQAAQALAEAGAAVERVAEQLHEASGVMDAWTLDWLVDNGAALVNRASQPAIDLLARAADQVPRTDQRREVIESRMATALRRMMRFGELQRWTRAVLASDAIGAEHRLEMSWALAYSLLYSDPPEGVRVARQALAHDNGGGWGARVHAMHALLLAWDADCGDPHPAIRQAHAAGERTGDPWAKATALQAEAMAVGRQDVAASAELFRRALAVIGDDPQTADLRTALLANLISQLDDMSRMEEADGAFADLLAGMGKYPSAMSQTRVHVYAATRHYQAGQWDDALAELESVELTPELGYYVVMGRCTRSLIAGHRDDRRAAAAQLAPLAQIPLNDQLTRNHALLLALARALIHERDGQPQRAFETLAPLIDPQLEHGVVDRFRWIAELVRLAVAVGEQETAREATRLATQDAEREPWPLWIAAAKACQGLLAGDPQPLATAAGLFGAGRRFLDQGIALENAAVLLAQRGQVPEARDAIAAALEEYARLGAAWDATRAETRLRPFGIRRGQRGPRDRRPSRGWEALTPTELRVAFLVADGLSNPAIGTELFLSRRTVQTHVSHILAKLDAQSRAEVASEAAGHRPALPTSRSRTAS